MAEKIITIVRQQYDANDATQLNGWKPNVISTNLNASGAAQQISTSDTDGIFIPADFKDHKTVFVFQNTNEGTKTVTFKAGNTYQGVNDLAVTVPAGVSMIWLDSAKFVDKVTGRIQVTTDEASTKLTMVGYEMR